MAAGKPPVAEVEQAVVSLWQATRDFTRAYEELLNASAEWAVERRSALDEAERRLEEAQHEVAKREAMARSVERMVEKHRDD